MGAGYVHKRSAGTRLLVMLDAQGAGLLVMLDADSYVPTSSPLCDGLRCSHSTQYPVRGTVVVSVVPGTVVVNGIRGSEYAISGTAEAPLSTRYAEAVLSTRYAEAVLSFRAVIINLRICTRAAMDLGSVHYAPMLCSSARICICYA
eukprot:1787131-Rhodomonas_salina.2